MTSVTAPREHIGSLISQSQPPTTARDTVALAFAGAEAPPLIQVITVPAADGTGGEWRFAHLSFQEALFVEVPPECR